MKKPTGDDLIAGVLMFVFILFPIFVLPWLIDWKLGVAFFLFYTFINLIGGVCALIEKLFE